MQHKTQHKQEPWAGEQTRRADTFFVPPSGAKSGHALESPAGKLGAILVLLAISSVAAVGMFMPDENKPLALSAKAGPHKIHLVRSENGLVPNTMSAPRSAPQQAYELAYELARQRVKTVGGLTRQQRIETAQDALAQVLGGKDSRLDSTAAESLAKRAPDTVRNAAFRGVTRGEAMGISAQSQLLVEHMLIRERRHLKSP